MPELDLPAGALVDAIDDAVLVVNEDDVVVEWNDAVEHTLAVDVPDSAESVSDVLAEYPVLEMQVQNREEGIVPVDVGDGTKYFQLCVSAVDSADRSLDVVLLHDVTAQQRQKRELERENEQLDQFASFISHDLRNPLDVAIGRTTVIDELVDDPQIEEHLEEIRTSHTRMIRIIQDVLTLARDGQSIDDKTPVDLGEVATDAWSHVETEDATLDVATDLTVLADPTRLGQVFENLFRNSLDHGTADADAITVTVGATDDERGFYVADDGSGIDQEIKGRVLEAGFSDDDGTGLGLAIVSNIAQAHGWDITVDGSEAGGARFDFTGVEIADET